MRGTRKFVLLFLGIFAFCSLYCFYQRSWTDRMPKLDGRRKVVTSNPYVIETTSLPGDPKFNPTIANGYVGHRIYSDTLYKNGLYNGEKGDSHRARIPGTLPYIDIETSQFISEEDKGQKFGYSARYVLDMKNGTYAQVFEIENVKSGDVLCTVAQQFYAHRFLTRILVTGITVEFTANGSFALPLKSSSGDPSKDIKFTDFIKSLNSDGKETSAVCGHTLTPEQPKMDVVPVCYIASKFPDKISLDTSMGKRFNFTFITSVGDNADEAEKFYEIALGMQRKNTLLYMHQLEWRKAWLNGSISLKSDCKSQSSSVVSALYYMLSAFPPMSVNAYPYEFFGVSPGGLTNGGKGQDYLGHVFWDQDFWMLPSLIPLFPEAVKDALKYRIARLDEAITKASQFGYQGATYPWESAFTGLDVCPGALYSDYEQHVTGDLIHTLKQYIYATGNWTFLREKIAASMSDGKPHSAWDMVYETAKFWSSRVVWDSTKAKYIIRSVMGPDEYHVPVDNSAFTNVVAAQNLKFAIEAAGKLNLSLPEKETFEKIAVNMYIPYDKTLDYHPEYDGYNGKATVKQADTIMLGFPLMANITSSSREHDLTIYGKTTDRNGPAMTWSMFAINWNALKQFSTADEYFLRQYDNVQPPFQIWSEVPGGGGAVNFLTGVGGYLQSILYGYLNLRIYEDYLALASRLPPGLDKKEVSGLVVSGLKFKGIVLDVDCNKDKYSVTLKDFQGSDHPVLLRSAEGNYTLSKIGDTASFTNSILCEVYIK